MVHKAKSSLAAVLVLTLLMTCFTGFTNAWANSVLKFGMEGSEVKTLQDTLKNLKFMDSDISSTGYFGSLTEEAVRDFQEYYGLSVDGIVGNEVYTKLADLGKANDEEILAKVQNIPESRVYEIQGLLYDLGYLGVKPTGYYGSLTIAATKAFQSKYGLEVDGIAGSITISALNSVKTKRSDTSGSSYIYNWYSDAQYMFSIGTTAKVYDVLTGKSFYVKRTYGTYHADVETLTAGDTETMKSVYGGSWSWTRRAILVIIDGTVMAASMNGMPHAGSESAAANAWVSWRSGDYGAGTNLDSVKGNGMDGVFCIHFEGSKTHGTQIVCPQHQTQIKNAAAWAAKYY